MSRIAEKQLLHDWDALCRDPRFDNFQHKIELSEHGKIIMSPASNDHAILRVLVIQLLTKLLPDGFGGSELAILTSAGVRVPDVCWCKNAADFLQLRGEVAALKAPEICVEIMSASNSMAEMETKRDLYFEAGCQEFILIDLKCFVTFFAPEGQVQDSAFAPGFPPKIEFPG